MRVRLPPSAPLYSARQRRRAPRRPERPLRGNPGGTMTLEIASRVPCYAFDVGSAHARQEKSGRVVASADRVG